MVNLPPFVAAKAISIIRLEYRAHQAFSDLQADAVKNKKTLDPSIQTAVTAKVDANQHLKEKVGGEYNASVLACKAKHPTG